MTRRQALGLILVFLMIGAGRQLRHWLLIGPDGQWQAQLAGESLLPPIISKTTAEKPPPPTGPFAINRTTADTLCFLSGVGPVLAARIIAERANGAFTDSEDLQRVKGIGPVMAKRIAPDLIFSSDQ